MPDTGLGGHSERLALDRSVPSGVWLEKADILMLVQIAFSTDAFHYPLGSVALATAVNIYRSSRILTDSGSCLNTFARNMNFLLPFWLDDDYKPAIFWW